MTDDLTRLIEQCRRDGNGPIEWLFDPHTSQNLRQCDPYLHNIEVDAKGAMWCRCLPVQIVVPPLLEPWPPSKDTTTIELVNEQCFTLVGRRPNGRLTYYDHPDNAEWAT